VRRSEDGAVAEHGHVGDEGRRGSMIIALNAIRHTIYSKSTYLLEIEEVSFTQ
jgi:hypothetical protein